jgi:hypothetical protein
MQETIMTLKYTYELDGDFFVGHRDDYPEYPTQGENLKDFEKNLLDIYDMIQKGTLEANHVNLSGQGKLKPRQPVTQ